MNTFEIIPTEENLIQALSEDLLSRNKDLVYFYNLLLSQNFSSSIALDGKWGSGKTFFVKQSMLLINAKNPMSNMEAEKRNSILASLPFKKNNEDVEENYDLAIYYDAWGNDNDTDPVLSLVYAITKQLSVEYKFGENSDVFGLVAAILEALSGRNIPGILEKLKSENPLQSIQNEKDLQENVNAFFSEILKERGNRLVIFIDELDRCKPSYAVKLLEKIKHYFGDARVTFVFSVNLEELQHTIKHHYGNTFDACRYLDRFFDMRISLPPADMDRFYRKIGLNSSYLMEHVCRRVIEVYNLELREITRFYGQVKVASFEPTHESQKWDFSFGEGRGKHMLLTFIVPIMVGLRIVDVSLYNEFVNGKNMKPLIDIYEDSYIGKRLLGSLVTREEAFEKIEGIKLVTREEKLKELYDAIFIMDYSNTYDKVVGEYEFNKNSKFFVKNVASMLSQYADFEA